MQSDTASAHAELVEAALAAFAHASGLGLFPDDDENWREDLVNGMRAALSVARVAIRREALEEAVDLLNSLGDHGSANFYASAIEALMDK
jgi:hypothetical protein